MKKLSKSDWRCVGFYSLGDPESCPERDTCMRYLAFKRYDRLHGINNYRGISVFMAVKNCKDKIQV